MTSVRIVHVLLIIILVLGFGIRLLNVRHYNTWWADDGGAHVAYVETILEHGRLPTMAETYVAWHEPLYYMTLAGWVALGRAVGLTSLDWWEFFSVVVGIAFLFTVWLLALSYGADRWLALALVALFSFLFAGVKLSAYVTNELAAQTLMVLATALFLRWRLLETGQWKLVVLWAVVLLVATLTKITAFVVLVAAAITWIAVAFFTRRRFTLGYLALTVAIVAAGNMPWFAYKYRHFDQLFSVNLYQEGARQSMFRSEAYGYLFRFDYHIFWDQPYWVDETKSFAAILIADAFSDHYNLFTNVDRLRDAPSRDKLLASGRFTTPRVRLAVLRAARVGLLVVSLWLVGLVGWLWRRGESLNGRSFADLFLFLLMLGSLGALVYENLLFPYLGLGVLKASFIYFAFPIVALLAGTWWWERCRSLLGRLLVFVGPIILYVVVSWSMLIIDS